MNHQEDDTLLRLIADQTPLYIAYSDAERRFIFLNQKYANWFGKTPDELVGKTLSEIGPAYGLVKPHEDQAYSGVLTKFEVKLPKPKGDIVSFTCEFIPRFDSSGKMIGVITIAQDITERQRTLFALEKGERQFRSLTDTIPQLMWTASAEGLVDFVNERCLKYTGLSTQAKFGEAWIHQVHSEDKERVMRAWMTSISEKIPFKEEYRLCNFAGEYHWFQGHAEPIRTSNGEVQYWIGTATDIEDEQRRTLELNAAKEAAESANRAKSAFLANMSHEIRTPLSSILGFSDLLKKDELSNKDRLRFAEIIERNGKMLTRIIDDILDLAKVESGRFVIEKVTFSPLELVQNVIDLFTPNATEKGISFTLQIDPEVPHKINSDPVRIRQILINLIGNAVKFTTHGGVYIRIGANFESKESLKLSLEIRDTGSGFSEAHSKQLFRPFTQADNSTTRRFGGTGLGLFLSKRLSQALNGDIVITQCGENLGSTFLVTVLVENPQSSAEDRTATTEQKGLENNTVGIRVLAVDDSLDNLELVRHLLELNGVSVDLANGGQEGISMVEKNSYDLVLMDIQMPNIDGYQALKTIRSNGHSMPVVALTAHGMTEDKIKTKAAGFAYHLTKPVNVSELNSVISQFASFGSGHARG